MKLKRVQQKKIDLINELEKEYENYPVKWGFNGLGYLIYKRTYAHKKYDENNNVISHEEYNNTVARELRQAIKMGVPLTPKQIKEIFKMRMDLDFSFAGRYSWQSEQKLANEGIYNSFINCWYYNIDNYFDICKIFDQLMLGGGCGFSVRKRHYEKLPVVQDFDIEFNNEVNYLELKDKLEIDLEQGGFVGNTYVVGDSREGWVNLTHNIFKSVFGEGKKEFEINTTPVRKKGVPIKGFGGVASGDESLIKGLQQIIEIFKNAVGRKLTSIELLDIICIIGSIVVSGNVRRTALIAIGDIDDIKFITSKRWDLQEVPSYRAMVNISVECNNDDFNKLPQEFWDSYEKLGECIGLFNLEACKRYGRVFDNKEQEQNEFNNIYQDILNEKHEDILNNNDLNQLCDPKVEGCNPCCLSVSPVLEKTKGLIKFDNLEENDVIWSKEGWTRVVKKWSNGIKDAYAFKTTAGIFYGTKNHRIVENGTKIEIENAKGIDMFSCQYSNEATIDPQDVVDGLVMGDGTWQENKIYLCIGQNDQDYFNSEVASFIGTSYYSQKMYKIETTIQLGELDYTYNREIPSRFIGNRNKMIGFLRGLYSANGSVVAQGYRVTLKASSKKIIEQVQLMLNSLGIMSYYTTNKASNVKFSNGEYLCKQSYDLNISETKKFKELIGFIQQYKMDKIVDKQEPTSPKKSTYDICEIEYLGEQEVFDITVDNNSHTYWTYGCNVSNCGETSLYSGEMCLLSIVNSERPYKTVKKALKYAFLTSKYISQGKYIYDQDYLNKSARIGIDLCGFTTEYKHYLKVGKKLYSYIRNEDKKVSKKHNLPLCSKMTAVKPNGTQALIMGIRSGIHFDPYPFYYRTVRFASNDPLLPKLKLLGYRIEPLYLEVQRNEKGEMILDENNHPIPTRIDENTSVVYFAIKSKTNQTEENVGAIEQMEINRKWQQTFVDQSISQTVKYHDEELPIIKEYLSNNWDKFKTISFLKHSNYNFAQMPIQKISEEEYNSYISKVKPISKESLGQYNDQLEFELDNLECSNGVCPIK